MKERKIRVAHYMPPYPSLNGADAFCRGLTRAMNRYEPGSGVIITSNQEAIAGPNEELLIYKRPPGYFDVPVELKNDLTSRRHGLDGIVLHGTYNPPMVALAKFLGKVGLPYIFIPHDPYPPSLREHHRIRKWAFWHLFEKRMIEKAAAVQLLDQSHEKFLSDLGCRAPIFVQPNGCEIETLELLKGRDYVPGSRFCAQIHYLGRMDRNHKGLDLLIKGFSKVAGNWEAELVLTGNDWLDRKELESLVGRLGLTDRVRFRGRRPEPSIQLQAESDLCVLTSRFDGFGLTVVEAMLAGRPVLVSREAGVASHVEAAGGGWIVDPSVSGIADGFRKAWASYSEWPELGRRNREYVLQNLAWDQVAKSTLKKYREIFHQ